MFHLNSCLCHQVYFTTKSIVDDFVQLIFLKPTFRLPWNQRIVRGWIGETVFSAISSSLYLFTNVMFLSFFIGICEFHRAFLDYFNGLVIKVENINRHAEGPDIRTMLCDIIDFHVAIKRFVIAIHNLCHTNADVLQTFSIRRYFWKTAHVFSLILLTQLVFVVLHMTCSVFQMDMVKKNSALTAVKFQNFKNKRFSFCLSFIHSKSI